MHASIVVDKQKHAGRRYCNIAILSAIYVLLIDEEKQREKEKRKHSTWMRPWLARREGRGFVHQLFQTNTVDVHLIGSITPGRVTSCHECRAKCYNVATRVTEFVILSRKIKLIQFLETCPRDFSVVASPVRGWLNG